MLVADPAQLLHEDIRRNHVATLSLDGLNENRGAFFRRQSRFEELFFVLAGAGQRKALFFLRAPTTAAIGVRITHVRDARNQRRKTPPLLGLGSGKRKSTHGAPMEAAKESDHVLPAGMVPG